MKTFVIVYDHSVYRPSNIGIYQQQKEFEVEIKADKEVYVWDILRKEYNKNPFYFKIKEVKQS